jgi:hypothetical protein
MKEHKGAIRIQKNVRDAPLTMRKLIYLVYNL